MTIIRPEVLPDEYVDGYEGRVYQLNGWRKRADAMPTLLRHYFGRQQLGRDLSVVEILAQVSGLSTAAFVQAHTMVPLRRAFTKLNPGVEHGALETRSLLSLVAMRRIRPLAYACGKCIHEDLEFRGIAYWRREHQQPGVFACSKHGTPLSFTDRNDAFLGSPAARCNDLGSVDPAWTSALSTSDATKRFHAICADLIARKESIDERCVAGAVREQAQLRGLYLGRGPVDRPLLSELVRRSFDQSWLETVLPELTNVPTGKMWPPIDAAVLGKHAGIMSVAYVAILAAVFDCPDAALRAVIGWPRSVPNRPTESARENFPDDELRRHWVEGKGSYRGVARLLGCRTAQIYDRLERLGLPNLSGMGVHEVHELMAVLSGEKTDESDSRSKWSPERNAVGRAVAVINAPVLQLLRKISGPKRQRPTGPRVQPKPPPRRERDSTTS
jgi:hypothetical protein